MAAGAARPLARRARAVCLYAPFCPAPGVRHYSPTMMEHKMDSALHALVNRADGRSLAGLAVIAVRGGEIAYANALGFRDFSQRLPFTLDTRMRIASVSKTFTAIAAMQLVEAGLLDLDRDASDYLGFSLRNPRFPDRPITCRMLMSHTSSIRDNGDYWLPADKTTTDFFTTGQYFAAEPPGFYAYCNLNSCVLATVIEALSGEKFNRYMRARVLGPMGVGASFDLCDFAKADMELLSPVYRMGEGGWEAQIDDCHGQIVPRDAAREAVKPGVNGTLYGPQGGLRISVLELYRLIRLFLGGGAIDGARVLSGGSVEAMFTPAWTFDGQNGDTDGGSDMCYGLGVHILTNTPGDRLLRGRALNLAGHYGCAYGMFSGYMIDRRAGDGFAYLANGAQCDLEGPLGKGEYSANWFWTEQIVTALYEHVFP